MEQCQIRYKIVNMVIQQIRFMTLERLCEKPNVVILAEMASIQFRSKVCIHLRVCRSLVVFEIKFYVLIRIETSIKMKSEVQYLISECMNCIIKVYKIYA